MKNTSYSFSLAGLTLNHKELTAIGVDRLKEARQDAQDRRIKAQGSAIGAALWGTFSAVLCGGIGYAMKDATIPDGAAVLGLTTFGSSLILSVSTFFTQREKARQAKADEFAFDKAVVSLTRDPDDAQCPDTLKDLQAQGILYSGLRIA